MIQTSDWQPWKEKGFCLKILSFPNIGLNSEWAIERKQKEWWKWKACSFVVIPLFSTSVNGKMTWNKKHSANGLHWNKLEWQKSYKNDALKLIDYFGGDENENSFNQKNDRNDERGKHLHQKSFNVKVIQKLTNW